jgi:uncharacterized iron-regulated membrane protein
MNKFRKIIFWLHLISGVLGGIVIFIMCVTGALLSFEKDIAEFAERDMRYVASAENPNKLSVREILAKVAEAKPNGKPSSCPWRGASPSVASNASSSGSPGWPSTSRSTPSPSR